MPVANVPSSLSMGPVHSASKPSMKPSPSSSMPLSHCVVPVLVLPAVDEGEPPAVDEVPPSLELPAVEDPPPFEPEPKPPAPTLE